MDIVPFHITSHAVSAIFLAHTYIVTANIPDGFGRAKNILDTSSIYEQSSRVTKESHFIYFER